MNKENIQHCHQLCLETMRMLAFRMGQEVFGSELSYQRTVECSLIFFLFVILGTWNSENSW